MSYSPGAIRNAIRDVLIGANGRVRTMPAATMLPGVFEGQPAVTQKAKTLHSAEHRFDVKIGPLKNHESSPVGAIGSFRIAQAEITIEVTTKTNSVIRLDSRDDVIASVLNDIEQAAQSLAFPGNVERTALLESTGIISGLLLGPGGEGYPVCEEVSQDWTAQLIRSRITASALIRIRQSTIVDSEPLDIFGSSLRAWYRGDQYQDTAYVQNISSWTDLSERGAALMPAVAPNLTLLVDFTTSLGQTSAMSLGALSFFVDYRVEGTAQFLEASDPPNVLVVGRFTQIDPGVASRIVDAVDGGGNVIFRANKNLAGNISYQVNATTVGTSTAADTSAHLFQFLHDGTNARIRVDNVAETVVAAAPRNAVAAKLGVPSTSSSECAAFEYWEVVLLDQYPTETQRAQYRQYVVDRYGLALTA